MGSDWRRFVPVALAWCAFLVIHVVTLLFRVPLILIDRSIPYLPRWCWKAAQAATGRTLTCLISCFPAAYDAIFLPEVPPEVEIPPPPVDIARLPSPGNSKPPPFRSISFAGCSWLLPYHLGVMQALLSANLIHPDTTFYGSSCGAIIAAGMACGVPLEASMNLVTNMARDASSNTRFAGAVCRMSTYVRTGLERILPRDAHLRATDRLVVSVTQYGGWDRSGSTLLNIHRATISTFPSRAALIDSIVASCYIPIYYERPMRGTLASGLFYLDGGMTELLPVDARGGTLTVSPYAGTASISPARGGEQWFDPLARVISPSKDELLRYWEKGHEDAKRHKVVCGG